MSDIAFARVTIEFPDGRVITAMVDSANIEFNELYRDPWRYAAIGDFGATVSDVMSKTAFGQTTWRAELSGRMARVSATDRQSAKDTLEQRRTASEWRCDFCGAVMPRAQGQCTQCAGWRSFLYD